MPLPDRAAIAVLSRLGPSWKLIRQDLHAPDQGWDVLTLTYLRDFGPTATTTAGPLTAPAVAALWPVGFRPLTDLDFWVVSRKPRHVAANIWSITLICHGASSSRPVKVHIRSTSEVQTLPGLTTIHPPYAPRLVNVTRGTVLEAQPALSISYVLIGQPPPTAHIGRAGEAYQTPAAVVAVRPTVWGYLGNPAYHFPFGWVLSDLDADVLSGTDEPVSLITENWIYRHLKTP